MTTIFTSMTQTTPMLEPAKDIHHSSLLWTGQLIPSTFAPTVVPMSFSSLIKIMVGPKTKV